MTQYHIWICIHLITLSALIAQKNMGAEGSCKKAAEVLPFWSSSRNLNQSCSRWSNEVTG